MAKELETATHTLAGVPIDRAKQMTSRMALQLATHSIHQRLHHHPGLARLAAGTIGRDEYRRLLGRSYGFYSVAEPLVDISRGLTNCLAEDLIDLGMTCTEVSGLPRSLLMKISDGHAERIGIRYVFLGASLGGKVMARAIARREAKLPIRFLTSQGDAAWKNFAADLEVNLPDVASRTQAATAALVTFAAYEDWMAGHE